MITLVFLVCNVLSNECYSATSQVVYTTEEECVLDAEAILSRNYALQAEGKGPPEVAIYKCVPWGAPA